MKDFNIEYANGYISVNVNNYFVKADLPSIKRLFKVAKEFCTEKQRLSLIDELRNSKTYWSEMCSEKQKLYFHRKVQLSQITEELAPNTKNQLLKLQAKLDRVIEILQMEHWENETSLD